MVCGKSNRNIIFNQFYIFGYFQLFTTMFKLLLILFIIFEVDMSSSVHANNKNKDTLILGKGQTQGLDNITLTAKGEYSISFSKSQRKFSSLHYNGSNSFLCANATKVYQFKAKDSKVKAYSLCLGNISIDFSVDKVKKGALNRYVHDFNFDYNAISVDDVLQIHKYLMRKHDMK